MKSVDPEELFEGLSELILLSKEDKDLLKRLLMEDPRQMVLKQEVNSETRLGLKERLLTMKDFNKGGRLIMTVFPQLISVAGRPRFI